MNKESFLLWKEYFNPHKKKALNDMFDYNLTDSKNLRSLFFTQGSKEINIISICLEILQSYLLITDDIMDKSSVRRGKPCWYKVVGYKAIKDSFFLLSLIFKTLFEYERIMGYPLKNKEKIVKMFYEVNFFTLLGQTEDTYKEIKNINDVIENYNWSVYKRIIKFKTSFYTTILPLKLRYLKLEKDFSDEIEEFAVLLGEYMQFQDDYLNFYPEMSGKSGTDVQEKKLTYYSCLLVKNGDENVFRKYFFEDDFEFIMPYFMSFLENYEKEEQIFYDKFNKYNFIDEFNFIMNLILL